MIIHNAKNCRIKEEDKQVLKNGGMFILITILIIVAYACIVMPISAMREKKFVGTDSKTETQFKVILRDKYIDEDFVQQISTTGWNSYEVYDSNMKRHRIIWKEVE